MSTTLGNFDALNRAKTLRTDTLADSVLILLGLTAFHRVVGFCRAILFCRWLEPEQLGQWDMAFSFLMLAAPASVLAMSGAFPRYAEHYRKRGQLRTVLKRTALACAALGLLAVAVIHLASGWFSQLIFGTPDRTDLVAVLAGSLIGMIAMNYFIDLFSALRNVRLIAGLQLVNSLAFATLGIALVLGWQCTAVSVVIAYGGACTLAAGGGTCWLLRNWHSIPGDAEPPPHRDLWSKVLPYAAWIWTTSLLANLFVIADRYMILHCSEGSASETLARVGEYHSSRVLPLIVVSIAVVLNSIFTAHLSHDWETGRRDRVAQRLNLLLKLFGFAFSAAGVLILLAAPLLFGEFFGGRFAGGLAVLPWTLTYSVWFAMMILAQNYMLCSEKAHLPSIALLGGLVVNVGLNLLLLPRLGLLGAVLATVAGNLVALLLVAALNRRLGFRMDLGTRAVLAVPLFFCLGPWATLAVLSALLFGAIHTDRFLSGDEKRELAEGVARYWQQFRGLRLAWKSAGENS
ncbi:MAG: lipopolysaccharide biosynthesis protein [Planctomycetota bacterium]